MSSKVLNMDHTRFPETLTERKHRLVPFLNTHSTCPTADGRDLEVWERLKIENLRIFAVFVAGVLEQLGPPDMADRLTEAMRIRRILAPDPPFKGGP